MQSKLIFLLLGLMAFWLAVSDAATDCPTMFNTVNCTACEQTLFNLTVLNDPANIDSPLTCEHFTLYTTFTGSDKVLNTSVATNPSNIATQKYCSQPNPCPDSFSIQGYKQIEKSCSA